MKISIAVFYLLLKLSTSGSVNVNESDDIKKWKLQTENCLSVNTDVQHIIHDLEGTLNYYRARCTCPSLSSLPQSLTQECQNLAKENEKVSNDYKTKIQELKECQSSNNQLKGQNYQATVNIKDLNKQLEVKESELKIVQRQLKESQDTKSMLENQNKAEKFVSEKLRQELAQKSLELSQAQSEITRLKNVVPEVKSKLINKKLENII